MPWEFGRLIGSLWKGKAPSRITKARWELLTFESGTFKCVDPGLSAVRTASSCEWLRIYGDLSNNSVSLLDQMGGKMTNEECPVPFPDSFYRQINKAKVEDKLKFIGDSLSQIMELYQSNLSAVSWNRNKTDHFLIIMNRQVQEIKSCVAANKQASQQADQPAGCQANIEIHRRLCHYYKKLLRSTVHRMGGSAASWELIRKETKMHLERMDLLQATIPRPPRSG